MLFKEREREPIQRTERLMDLTNMKGKNSIGELKNKLRKSTRKQNRKTKKKIRKYER